MEDIMEGNKLIMKFAGNLKILKISPLVYKVNGQNFRLREEPKDYEDYFLTLFCDPNNTGSIKYHSSWNLLMPVVEKIESLHYDTRIAATYFLEDGDYKAVYYMDIETLTGLTISYTKERKSKIETVWISIINFIKWYNNQPK